MPTNGHGPTWFITNQARTITKHESNSATCQYFHINMGYLNVLIKLIKSLLTE
jgi:hypothetical protein